MDSIRQAPRHIQGLHWDMLEEISLHVLHTTSNAIRHRNTGNYLPNKEQGSSRTNKDGKEYVKHHILGEKNIHLCKRKFKSHRRD